MAQFSLSPAVTVVETDNTLTADMIGDYIGGMAGVFNWGPVDAPKLITGGETELKNVFGPPTNDNYLPFLVAADYLSYSPKAWIMRMVGDAARNATPASSAAVLVKNEAEAEAANLSGLQFLAKYPGTKGNGISVNVADSTNFSAWEFASSFDYTPKTGEFAVAVIDTSGAWTGAGALNQQEKLIVNGTAKGGTRQVQTLAFTGSATGGTKQIEQLTVTGTSTGTSLTVNGTAVTIANGDTASQVATKIAAAMTAVSATYASAIASGATVQVTFTAAGERTKIFDVTQSGITVTSTIQTVGNAAFNLTVYDEVVPVQYGDTATIVATKVYNFLLSRGNTYTSVSQPNATSITYTFVDYGLKSTTPSVVSNGVTIATTVGTPGASAINLSVFGQTVAILHNDTSTTVASKIAAALNAMGTPLFSGIVAEKNSVNYRKLTAGRAAKQATPATQVALTFEVDVTQVGRLGTILSKYELMSNVVGSKLNDGSSQFYADAMQNDPYVIVGDKTIALASGATLLNGGVDDNSNVNLTDGFQELGNSEQYQINYLFDAAAPSSVQKIMYDVADTRKDCIAFSAPPFAAVVNNKGGEMEDVLSWRNLDVNRETSYGFNVDNWALVYDAYNDVNRWIPVNGGTAGLKARTDREQNPWDSPAGHENGRFKNYIRLAWSANKAQRDELYKSSVNSVVSFPGEGILLYGDKTSMTRPSAFRHINVRSAFIVAEVSLAKLAKYFLFKNNTPYTRAQFLNATRPLIRNMVAQGAFEDGKIVADDRNNGPDVRRANQLVGNIYLIPNYSINNVILNFEATSAGVSFEEIENFA